MISSVLLLLYSSPILILVVFMYRSSSKKKKKEHSMLPPSPPGLPIIGNFHQIIGGVTHRSLHALATRYGHLMLLKLGSVPTVVVSSAEAAEEVMKTRDLSFASRPPSVIAETLMYGSRDIGFSPYGEYWRQVRRIGVLHLLNAKRVQSFRGITEDEVSSLVHRIRTSAAAGERVNLSELLITLTNNIICRAALGRKYSEGSNKCRELLDEAMNLLGAFPVGDYMPWLAWVDTLSGLLRRARRNALEFDNLIEQALHDHHLHAEAQESSPDAKGFLDILLSLDKEGSVGMSLSRDSIKAIILDIFSWGTYTMFTTLEWAMAELMRHPAILQKVQDEVRKNVGTKACITGEDISNMIYFKAAIKETFRLHPAVPLLVPREAVESSKLCGYDVPAKARVVINAWAIGRDPKYWDRPEEFIPDRFLNSPIDFKGFEFQFIPFGAGRRGCPGIPFAIPNMELALANLLYHFNWEMSDGLRGEEMDMTEVAGHAVHKKTNLLLLAAPHSF